MLSRNYEQYAHNLKKKTHDTIRKVCVQYEQYELDRRQYSRNLEISCVLSLGI